MKKVLWMLIIASLLSAAEQNRAVKAVEKGYQNWGIGGGLSLVVPENSWWGVYSNTGVGPGVELKGTVRFGLGNAGSVHYVPSINWWGRWDKWGDKNLHNDVEISEWELNMNFFDARYVPPVPKDLVIKPYAGFGLLGFSIYHYKEEIGINHNTPYHQGYTYIEDTDFEVIQNFFLGAEFTLNNGFWPYMEFKFSNGNVHEFIMTAGFTIQGRK